MKNASLLAAGLALFAVSMPGADQPLGTFEILPVAAWQPSQAMLRQLFEQALARSRGEYGDSDARTAQAARDLGMFLSRQGDSEGARGALAEALRIDEKALGPTAPRTLADAAELASVSAPGEAKPLWLRAAGSSDAQAAARALAALGQLHENAGDSRGAAKFYRRALGIEEESSGQDSARVAVRLNALARVANHPEGIALLERALAINRRRVGERHLETATIEANLAALLLEAGRVDQAMRYSRNALAIIDETLGIDHPRSAAVSITLAYALRVKGDTAGAERMYRRALAIDERVYGPRHEQTLSDVRILAEFLREIGKARKASEIEKRLLNEAP